MHIKCAHVSWNKEDLIQVCTIWRAQDSGIMPLPLMPWNQSFVTVWWLWIPELLKLGGLENSNFPADRQKTPEKTCTKYIWNYIHNNCSYCDSSCEPKVSLILPVYTFLGSTNKSIKYQNQQIHLVPRQTFSTSFKSDWPRHREQSTLNSFCKRY